MIFYFTIKDPLKILFTDKFSHAPNHYNILSE